MKYFVYFTLMFLVSGCTSFAISQSSGQVGCPESEISIENDSGVGLIQRTWTAVCKDQLFYCTHTFSNSMTSCRQELK